MRVGGVRVREEERRGAEDVAPGASRQGRVSPLCCACGPLREGGESERVGRTERAATKSGSLDAQTERPRSPTPPPLPAAWIGLESSSLFLERDGRGRERERGCKLLRHTTHSLAHPPTRSLGVVGGAQTEAQSLREEEGNVSGDDDCEWTDGEKNDHSIHTPKKTTTV